MKLFTDKIVLITGASRGIGRAIARQFALQGAHVAFTYLQSETSAQSLEIELGELGIQCKAYQSDAASFTAADDLVKNIINEFGRVDILVNNAGQTDDNLLVRMSEAQWDKIIRINLKSVFAFTRAVIKHHMRANGGSIINLTSVIGLKGNAGQSNYAASKAGVIGFTKSIALEMAARNIRVNAVAPGFIETEMTSKVSPDLKEKYRQLIPMKRMGNADEVANLCLFLASEKSSYITGQVIQVDGGMLT